MKNIILGIFFLIIDGFCFWQFYDYIIVVFIGFLPILLFIISIILLITGIIVIKDFKKSEKEELKYND